MKDKLDSYIGRVETLPATPAVLVKLIGLFQQADPDVDQIVELMSRDPSLTAEVLRHSNSASTGGEDRIVDIFDAIMRLGFYTVYQTAVAKFGMQALALPQQTYGIDVAALWQHSATVAATAGALARKAQEPEGLAFTAGLLHDVGKIVLVSAEGTRYAVLANEIADDSPLLEEKELEMFGFTHSEVGARLLDRWELPIEISVPVRYHHRVDWLEPHERLCAIVSLGDTLAHLVEANAPTLQLNSKEAICAMRVLQLEETDMAPLMQDAQKDIEHLTKLLSAAGK